jgi:hypothetical protein
VRSTSELVLYPNVCRLTHGYSRSELKVYRSLGVVVEGEVRMHRSCCDFLPISDSATSDAFAQRRTHTRVSRRQVKAGCSLAPSPTHKRLVLKDRRIGDGVSDQVVGILRGGELAVV